MLPCRDLEIKASYLASTERERERERDFSLLKIYESSLDFEVLHNMCLSFKSFNTLVTSHQNVPYKEMCMIHVHPL